MAWTGKNLAFTKILKLSPLVILDKKKLFTIIFRYLKRHVKQNIFYYLTAKVVQKMYFKESIYSNYVNTQQGCEPKMVHFLLFNCEGCAKDVL